MYSNLVTLSRRLSSTSMKFDVLMKQFNDQKKYRQSIDLFDKFLKENTMEKISSLAVTQAIRALIELKQYRRAMEIEQNLSPNLIQNDFIRYQCIRLYSRSFLWKPISNRRYFSTLFCSEVRKCIKGKRSL